MSHELIYTSVPQGLRPGTRGFCAVAQTNGIPAALLERLESISGYRHLYEPQSARAKINPVAWSYLRLTVGNTRTMVLSRVADAGLDYSQRTNKLAHHLACAVNECPAAGPAATLQQSDLLLALWDEKPRLLPAGRVPRSADRSAQPCLHWQRVMGDAGWAGLLAETVLTKREAYVIFQPGVEVLELFAEAIALLPIDQRWEATFQTYYTRLPPGIECRWKGVVAGSEEENIARRATNALVIDLTQKTPVPQETPSVAAARQGQPLPIKPAARSAPPAIPLAKAAPTLPSRVMPPEYDIDLPSLQPEHHDPLLAKFAPPTLPSWDPSNTKLVRRSKARFYVLSGLAVLLLSGGLLGGMYALGMFSTPPVIADEKPPENTIGENRNSVKVPPKEAVSSDPVAKDELQQRQSAWEEKMQPLLQEAQKYGSELQALEVPFRQQLETAKSDIQSETINSLTNAKNELEQKIVGLEKAFDKLKKDETYFQHVNFKKSQILTEITHLAEQLNSSRQLEQNAKTEIASLMTKLKQAKSQAEREQKQLANTKALEDLNKVRYLDLSTITKDGHDEPNGERVISLLVSDLNSIQLQLLNLPETIYQLKSDSKATWSLVKRAETPGGSSTTLGHFSMQKDGLVYKPNANVKNWLKDLGVGILRIRLDNDPAAPTADLWLTKPKVTQLTDQLPLNEAIRVPVNQLNRRLTIEWDYPASQNETLVLSSKMISNNKEQPWKTAAANVSAPLTPDAHQELSLACGLKRDGQKNLARTYLQIEPYIFKFSEQHPQLSEPQLDSWLSNTFQAYKIFQDEEKKRKQERDNMKEKKGVNEKEMHQLEKTHRAARESGRSKLHLRWPFEWTEEYVQKFEDKQLGDQNMSTFMREKYGPLIDNYELEIRAYRRIPIDDKGKYVDVELPYSN